MYRTGTHRERVRVRDGRDHPGLWIGDLSAALAADYLELANVTHIVRALKQTIPPPAALPSSGRVIPPENVKHVRVDDVDGAPILVHFSAVNELIHAVLDEVWVEDEVQEGEEDGEHKRGPEAERGRDGKWGHWETMGEGTVLLHCQAGLSRSVTVSVELPTFHHTSD